MIELERSRDGHLKSFKSHIAQDALIRAKGQKDRNQTFWKLPEDSEYKEDKDGLIVLKPKKRTPKKEEES